LAREPGAKFVPQRYANQISGVTSLANLLSLVVVLLMIRPRITQRARGRTEKLVLAFIIMLAAFKAVMHSERLALIELLVPLSITAVALRRHSRAWALAPFVGATLLFFFFMATEYLRSWSFHENASNGLLGFAFDRMLAYYIGAMNNGAFVYGYQNTFFFPVFTGQWIWHLPIPHLQDFLTTVTGVRVDVEELLSRGENVEFNNTSGIFAPLIDFGPILGICCWIVLGYLSGRLFRAFSEGHCVGLILFPTWFVGLLEMPRIFYWGDNRFFPTLVCSVAISVAFLFLVPSTPPRPDRRTFWDATTLDRRVV
jgi:oligosaccharide repeat unit polymerase